MDKAEVCLISSPGDSGTSLPFFLPPFFPASLSTFLPGYMYDQAIKMVRNIPYSTNACFTYALHVLHAYSRPQLIIVLALNQNISFMGFPCDAVVKNLLASARDVGSIPGWGNGNPLQYPCLENSMDRRVWRVTVHGVAE